MAISELHLTYSAISINKVTFNTSHLGAPTERVFNYQMCILKGDYLNYDVSPVFSDKGDPDEMPNHAAFHPSPHCLPKFRLAAFRLRNTSYTKCINIIIDSIAHSLILRSIGHSLILRSIFMHFNLNHFNIRASKAIVFKI